MNEPSGPGPSTPTEPLLSSARGFWLGASSAEPCDQTMETPFELARFYLCSLPEDLRVQLADLDRVGPGREAPFAPAFGASLDRAISELAPLSKGLARRQARRKALLAAGGSERDASGLSFAHAADQPDGCAHWGALLVFFDACSCLDSNRTEFWSVPSAGRERALAIAERTAELTLDALESQWGLPPAVAFHRRVDSRVHWGDSFPPSCLDSLPNMTARALCEADDIEGATRKAAPSRKRSL